jgi:hypothetical protein
MCLNPKDAIIVQLATDVFSTWTITVLGSITALDSGTENISYFC